MATKRVATGPSSKQSGPSFGYGEASELAGHLGRFAEGKNGLVKATHEIGERIRGATDNLHTVKSVTRGLARTNLGLAAAEEVLGTVSDLQQGIPASVVVPGAVLRGGAALGAGAAGGLIGQALVPIPGLGYLAGAGGGILASYLADRYLPSREQFGRTFHKVSKTYGEQPHFGLL